MKTTDQINPNNICCDECKRLTQTEEKQDNQSNSEIKHGGHICRKYQQRIKHLNVHPLLPRLLCCIIDDGKE